MVKSDERPETDPITCALCGDPLPADDAVLVNGGASWGCQSCKRRETAKAHVLDALKKIGVGIALMASAVIGIFIVGGLMMAAEWTWDTPTGRWCIAALGAVVGFLALAYFLGHLWYETTRPTEIIPGSGNQRKENDNV